MLCLAAVIRLLLSPGLAAVSIRENDPVHCRCGEARKGKKVTPRDIQAGRPVRKMSTKTC